MSSLSLIAYLLAFLLPGCGNSLLETVPLLGEPKESVLIHTDVCREPPICVMTSRSQEWGEPRRGATGHSTGLKEKKKKACLRSCQKTSASYPTMPATALRKQPSKTCMIGSILFLNEQMGELKMGCLC